jgi:hypothetical protein
MTEAFIDSNNPPFEPAPQVAYGATPMNWVETFTGILCAPVQTMRALALLSDTHQAGIGGAALAVLLPFALDGIRLTPPSNLLFVWFNVPFAIILGMLLWLTIAGVYALTGSIFGSPRKFCRRAFVLTGWSYAPWMFMAPVYCYRELLGPAFTIFAAIPLVWTFILQMLAVKESFELRSSQVLALFFVVPVLYSAQQIMQLVQSVYVSLTSMM